MDLPVIAFPGHSCSVSQYSAVASWHWISRLVNVFSWSLHLLSKRVSNSLTCHLNVQTTRHTCDIVVFIGPEWDFATEPAMRVAGRKCRHVSNILLVITGRSPKRSTQTAKVASRPTPRKELMKTFVHGSPCQHWRGRPQSVM